MGKIMKLKSFLACSHRLILAIFVLVLHSSVVHADEWDGFNKENCPDLSGTWQRGGDSMLINYEQNGCLVNSTSADTVGFEHEIKLKWENRSQRFFYLVTRKNLSSGCVTKMKGYVTVANQNKYVANIFATDGRCGLPTNFKETSTWERK
jgi:hypothetical protein